METTKMCAGCACWLSLDNFYRDRSRPDGRDCYCKPCKNLRITACKAKNPEKYTAYKRVWRTRDPERLEAIRKRGRDRGRERRAEQRAEQKA